MPSIRFCTFLLIILVAPHLCLVSFGQPVKIVLVGDSTVNDGGGWGPGFRARFGPEVEVLNLALNGRSSKSFRDEGAWQPAIDAEADYILIQFGHNDCPGKGPTRETVPETTYRENLTRYLLEARTAGARPVLVTSIVRRAFTADGKIKPDCLVPFVREVRRLAAEQSVGLIDLYALTLAQAEQLGPAVSAELGPKKADGTLDTTHLAPRGQREIGAMAAREFVRLEPDMKKWMTAK
jgi:lysophospholipase L1-like esterase